MPGIVVGGVAALAALFGWVAVAYRGALVWPTFAGGFAATALGVFLGLYAERAVAERRDRRARRLEARLAYSALAAELRALRRGLVWLAEQHTGEDYLTIALPTGSWEGVRSRLGFATTEFELFAEVAQLYGRIDDIRELIRLKSEASAAANHAAARTIDTRLSDILDGALVTLDALQSRVRGQIDKPTTDSLDNF
jgi:hypothetical protein